MVRFSRVLIVLLAASLVGCGRERETFRGASVIVVSIDTLRSDHLPVYGYRGVATPNLDALAADSLVFDRAYSHVPLTLPSHATLFTGLLPAENGVRDNVAFSLAATHPTMASFFNSHGYATGGAVSAIVLSHESGIARGFDFYEDSVEATRLRESLGRVQRAGMETEGKLAEWLAGEKRRPLFAFLHIYEPHSPYEPPEPFAKRYRERPYDGEIAAADAVVGRFVGELKAQGLYEDSIVVLLSDHGEGLDDHGEAEHGIFLYRESIQVPLWIKLPGSRRRGQRVESPVGLIDVFPTVAELAGLTPPEKLSGISLRGIVAGKAPGERQIFSETFYARFHLGWSDLASLVTSRHQYIEAPRPELYDLVADPAEKRDLAPEKPEQFRELRIALSRLRGPKPSPEAGDPERARKLAALGYLTAKSPDADTRDLPDPKDRIGELIPLREAFGFYSKGDFPHAAEVLGSLVRQHPSMSDAWEMYAQALHRLGRNDEALAAYQTADRLTPGNAPLLLEMSAFSLEVGRLDEAKRYVRLAEAAGAPDVHQTLAQIAVAENDLKTAEAQARLALGDRPGRRVPLLILARIARERGDLAGALTHLDEIARLTREKGLPPLSLESGLRGDVLARLGKDAEAEAAFREEIRLFPENPQAWCNLALLYASQSRDALARETLESLVRTAPSADNFHAAVQTARILGDQQLAGRFAQEERRRLGGPSANRVSREPVAQ